jgi:hypothetical protein
MNNPAIAQAILDANKIINKAMMEVAACYPIWLKLDKTKEYLNKQVSELLTDTL